jgi:CAAX protease family protein
MTSMSRSAFLRLEWGISLALVAVTLAWAGLRDLPLAGQWSLDPRCLSAGAGAGALLWLCIPLLRRSLAIRRVWDGVLVPFARGLSTLDILSIALLSGISEELFFRGVLLHETGIVASSVVFGLLHALTPLYALWAGLTGAGFALLTLHSGSLVTAMAAHATYNAGALLALRHWYERGSTAPEETIRL